MDETQNQDISSSIGRVLFTQGGPDHPRLNHEVTVALGSVFLVLIIIVAVIGIWRQAQAERKPRRRSSSSRKRVDLMRAVMPPDQVDQERQSSRGDPPSSQNDSSGH